MSKILVIGAAGQIGVELVIALRNKYGHERVIASDLKIDVPAELLLGKYIQMDALDKDFVRDYIISEQITDVYLLAALLSASAEKKPSLAWRLNMESLLTVLDLAKEGYVKKIFWPSSIAVFGNSTPKINTPQTTVMDPSTVYGISKLAGERWCEYYHKTHNVDVRSVRFPGLISYSALPGGGTTDYAVDIFYHAKRNGSYKCFLSENRELPMMYMDDAIRAVIELMDAPSEQLTIRSSYNITACSFTPRSLSQEIRKSYLQDFKIKYSPDFRDQVAKSWPTSIDDSIARQDWGWQHKYTTKDIVSIMMENVNEFKMG